MVPAINQDTVTGNKSYTSIGNKSDICTGKKSETGTFWVPEDQYGASLIYMYTYMNLHYIQGGGEKKLKCFAKSFDSELLN